MTGAKIVITGASSGIGRALYQGFEKSMYVIEEIIGISRDGPTLDLDLRDPLPEWPIVEGVNLLINCAGILDLEEKNPRDLFDVNFWGTYNLIMNLYPAMPSGSCIINIASVSGMRADADLPIYAASKAAIISLTQSLALKFAPDVRVNCISPGFYATNLVPGEVPVELIETIPMKYVDDPEHLYKVVETIWLSRYMTGSNIVIDGGVSL